MYDDLIVARPLTRFVAKISDSQVFWAVSPFCYCLGSRGELRAPEVSVQR